MAGKTINGAEILAAGKFYPGNLNGEAVEFTEADLDHIVAAFAERASAGRVPLKLGHNDAQPITDGQPALGWVSRVWREGAKLLADFSGMPAAVYDAIKAGLYKFISVELSKDVQTAGGLRSWALNAAALLGADIPAVGTLKDLQALTLSARAGLQPAVTFTLTRGAQSIGARSTMTDEELKELKARFSALESENATLKAAGAAREAEVQKEKVERRRAEIRAMFKAAEDTGRILPRVQHRFCEVSRYFKDDIEVVKFSDADIEAEIKENEIPEAQRKSLGGGGGGRTKMSDDKEARYAAMTPDARVAREIEDVAVEQRLDLSNPIDQSKAQRVVFQRNPELAKAYLNMPGVAPARV